MKTQLLKTGSLKSAQFTIDGTGLCTMSLPVNFLFATAVVLDASDVMDNNAGNYFLASNTFTSVGCTVEQFISLQGAFGNGDGFTSLAFTTNIDLSIFVIPKNNVLSFQFDITGGYVPTKLVVLYVEY